jgi:hypothetical protein
MTFSPLSCAALAQRQLADVPTKLMVVIQGNPAAVDAKPNFLSGSVLMPVS